MESSKKKQICPNCQAMNYAGDRFCAVCNESLQSSYVGSPTLSSTSPLPPIAPNPEKGPLNSYANAHASNEIRQRIANTLAHRNRRGFIIGGVATALALLLAGGCAGYEAWSHNSDTLQVSLFYGSDKEQWLNSAIQAFNKQNKTLKGRQIQINLNEIGGTEAINGIVSKTLQPTAWFAGSSLELSQLKQQWQSKYGSNIVASGNFSPQTLIQTPLAFGIWHDRAQVLLQKYGSITFANIHEALITPNGWADLGGNPDWHNVKLGQTSPQTSNLGVLWLILIAYEFNGIYDILTLAKVQNNAFYKYLVSVEEKVHQFGKGSGSYIEQIVAIDGPSSFDIVFSEESVLLSYYQTLLHAQNQPLDIYYPSPTLLRDNTYAILQGPWITSDQQEAALLFQQFLWSSEQQISALQYGFRPFNPEIQVDNSSATNLFLHPYPSTTPYSPDFKIQKSLPETFQTANQDVADYLLKLWIDNYGNLPIAGA
jgi:Bacterial extracellular solute-binding protein